MVTAMLCCGMYAPTAKNKRPCHFIVIRNRQLLAELASQNPQAAMLGSAAGAIVVCGDKNVEGMKEYSVIAFGWPDEEKELSHRWEPEKLHYDKW